MKNVNLHLKRSSIFCRYGNIILFYLGSFKNSVIDLELFSGKFVFAFGRPQACNIRPFNGRIL
jgi:hypothetical protein